MSDNEEPMLIVIPPDFSGSMDRHWLIDCSAGVRGGEVAVLCAGTGGKSILIDQLDTILTAAQSPEQIVIRCIEDHIPAVVLNDSKPDKPWIQRKRGKGKKVHDWQK